MSGASGEINLRVKKERYRRLTQTQCDRIAQKLNKRPGKRYNYRTPEELFIGMSFCCTSLLNLGDIVLFVGPNRMVD